MSGAQKQSRDRPGVEEEACGGGRTMPGSPFFASHAWKFRQHVRGEEGGANGI